MQARSRRRWVASLCAVGLLAGLAMLSPVAAQSFGFDHLVHDGRVSVAGKDAIDCSSCHRMTARGFLDGSPNHASCFGQCHPAPAPRPAAGQPYPEALERLATCGACHARDSLESAARGERAPLAAHFPPYTIEHDFGLLLDHPKHLAASERCQSCHGEQPTAGKPHQRCVACHVAPTAKIPPMTACTTCHPIAYGPASAPHLEHGIVRVTGAFDHRRHQRAAPTTTCVACHAAIAKTAGDRLPAPSAADCAGCHDGSKAFSTVTTACTRCHLEPSREPIGRPTPPPVFEHGPHLALLRAHLASEDPPSVARNAAAHTCATCHVLTADGRPQRPGRGHAPCADGGCHREAFGIPGAPLCASCHIGAEPWRRLHADRERGALSEFGARYAHAAHARRGAPACERCHVAGQAVALGNALDLMIADGHGVCGGETCHPTTGVGGPLASFAECDRCHVEGLLRRREETRQRRPWTVKERFRHAQHRSFAGQPVACTTCHLEMNRAEAIDDIAPPRKATCLGCHDGSKAFKVTGHDCVRCHAVLPTKP